MPSPGRAPRPTAPRPEVDLARWSLMAQFALFGVLGTSWMSRLPSIRSELGLSAGQLGSLLVVGGAGTLLAVLVTGAVVARFGSRRTLAAATAGNVAGFGVLALATATGSIPLFAVGACVNGMCGALTNIPINISAAGVERAVGRATLPHFHAAFSVGAALGALVGAGFAWSGAHVAVQLVVVTAAVTLVRALLVVPATMLAPAHGRPATLGADARRGSGARAALAAWREPRTLLIGLVLLAASLSEGSAGTWLALAVVDGFAAREAVGAVAYGTFVASMTVVRFAGTGLIDRYGRVAVLRVSGLSALAGLLLFGLAPALVLAWVGVVLWGCGAALANPIAISAASDEPLHAAPRVSVATSFSTMSMLAAPPLLGLLADEVGVRSALLVICGAVVLSIAVAGQVRPPQDAPVASTARW
ncbi:fucose permease [Isoptericola sp. CG 20/1183]|uniref:Fucose permease n=1 Tax=Isoptericola halotolerans TaxID=300560 RepID=A0ABX5EFG9_9MICO|nr:MULTISPECIES: MFS transporter [Isoptericola]PRZ05634.1 fucose permease [Isoptericola halotolerans]PRZ06202.1 fucose permease [Isoptericola sp. CG 20/1183]